MNSVRCVTSAVLVSNSSIEVFVASSVDLTDCWLYKEASASAHSISMIVISKSDLYFFKNKKTELTALLATGPAL